MDHILHCLSLGETMRERFLSDAKNYAYGKALFLVPNRFFARLVKQRGVVKAAVIDYLAGEILRYNHREAAYQGVLRSTQKKLLEETLQELAPKLTYFAPLLEKKGFRDSLLALFDEFAMNGLTGGQYHQILLNWGREGSKKQKDLELDLLYFLYSHKMEDRGLYDLSGLYVAAAQVLEDGGTIPWDKVYFSEFYEFDAVQLQLIRALAKQCSVEIGLFYDPKRPELSGVTEKIYGTLLGSGFTPVQEPPVSQKESDLKDFALEWRPGHSGGQAARHVAFGRAPGVEQEIRLVLSQIKALLQNDVPPEDILVIVRHMADYQGLARSFAAYGIPCALPQVTNLAGQVLPDFLTKLFTALQGSYRVDLWQNLLGCPLTEELWHCRRDVLAQLYTTTYFASASDLLSYVKRQELIDSGFWDVLAFCKADHTAAGWREQFLSYLEEWQLAQHWGQLHQQGKLDLLQVKVMTQTTEFVRDMLEAFVRRQEQCGRAEETLPLSTLAEFWQDSLQGSTVTLDIGSYRGIHVMEAGNVQGLTIPYVFLLGLREGLFPTIKRESWLYSDQERAELGALGLDLAVSARALEQDRYFFGSAAALATKQLFLSWYEDDEGGPSSYIQDLENFFTKDSIPVKAYDNTIEGCYSRPLFINELAERGRWQLRERNFLAEQLGERYFQRSRSEEQRWEEGGAFNGQVPNAVTQPLHLSASALDTYLQCPFGFLMGRVWQLEPWEPMTATPQPNVVGSLIHDTLAKFVGRHKGEQLLPDRSKELEQELLAILQENFQALVKKGDIPDSPYVPYLEKQYSKWLRIWLKKECAYEAADTRTLKPCKTEWAFGRSHSEWPALRYEVDGEPVYFSGQIDRIDTNGKEYVLWDYKTGAIPTNVLVANGQAVQLPLYLLALKELGRVPEESILGAGYCSVREGERKNGLWTGDAQKKLTWLKGRKRPTVADVQEKMEETISNAVRQLRQGNFPAKPQGGKCSPWCPARDICRYQENPHRSQEE